MNTKIEGAFSLRLINQSSISERVRKEHPGNMHLWWNRSPIDSSKELLISLLTPVQDTVSGDGDVTIVDPFSGFGGLTLAAVGTGPSVTAGDLNSVATVLTKAAAEIPARFADKPAVSEDAENRIYTGVEGLAEDILCYGTAIRHELANRLTSIYPDALEQGLDNKRVYAWIWTRSVTCPNPACGCHELSAVSGPTLAGDDSTKKNRNLIMREYTGNGPVVSVRPRQVLQQIFHRVYSPGFKLLFLFRRYSEYIQFHFF